MLTFDHAYLKHLRQTRRQCTQAQLATALNVSQGRYSEWERGKSEPTAKHLMALAEHYALHPRDLFEGRDHVLTTEAPTRGRHEVAPEPESRRASVRALTIEQGLPLEEVAGTLNVPLSVVESDIDALADRGPI
ncbi:helix-turn-helix domain-containing protein [Streptomyces sp. NPDC098789]|uniref:helix-turn-helix domain-containing protein n=1 Tax=Streptomyces sp. NPDC098789 TaxID=3366098 RepID=UPI00382D9B10